MDEKNKTAEVAILAEVTVSDLGGQIFRVNGAMVSGAAKMLAAVAAALGIAPKPRAPRDTKAKPAKAPKVKAE